MPPLPAGREAGPGHGVRAYRQHRPEQTLLYQLVAQYYPAFADLMAAQGRPLPDYFIFLTALPLPYFSLFIDFHNSSNNWYFR